MTITPNSTHLLQNAQPFSPPTLSDLHNYFLRWTGSQSTAESGLLVLVRCSFCQIRFLRGKKQGFIPKPANVGIFMRPVGQSCSNTRPTHPTPSPSEAGDPFFWGLVPCKLSPYQFLRTLFCCFKSSHAFPALFLGFSPLSWMLVPTTQTNFSPISPFWGTNPRCLHF